MSVRKLVIRVRDPSKIDLRSYGSVVNCVSPIQKSGKALVVDVLGQLLEHTESLIRTSSGDAKKKQQFRLSQFKKAINSLKSFEGDITSGRAARELPGIGKGIGDRVDEILRTGTLSELKVTQPIDPVNQLITELTSVTGIGESNAKRFIELGVTSLDDLRVKVARNEIKLTHHMSVGLRYYHDFEQKIPYNEIVDLGLVLKSSVSELYPDVLVEICGSHRRQKPLSGDIDVLMTSPNILSEGDLIKSPTHYLKNIVHCLKETGFIIDDLTSQGDTKYMGVCNHPIVKTGRRIDIRFVPYDSFYPAIVYFTGSMMLNKLMRTIAIEKHYLLNEYGLFKSINGEKESKIVVNSEREIFDLLGLVYLSPVEREIV
jgi:DNA polymerase/3'-5' exonuclease PolX